MCFFNLGLVFWFIFLSKGKEIFKCLVDKMFFFRFVVKKEEKGREGRGKEEKRKLKGKEKKRNGFLDFNLIGI